MTGRFPVALALLALAFPAGAQTLVSGGCTISCTLTTPTLVSPVISGTTTLPGGGQILSTGEIGIKTAVSGGNDLTVAGQITASQVIATNVASLAGALYWVSGSVMLGGTTDGNIKLSNNAQTSFGLLQLGGTSSSFPALKRTAATVEFRLADDSADTAIVATGATFNALTTGTNADFVCLSAGGVLLVQTTACTISSMRFKRDIVPLDGDALARINALEPVAFNMKDTPNADLNYGKRQIGLIAENIAAVDPRMAIYEDDGTTAKSYRQEAVIAALVAAVKELSACRLRVMGACWF